MTLIQAWIDSLQLLKPKNLKLFVLVTIKSIIEAYKLMFRFFWWLIPLFFGVFLLLALIGPYTIPNYYGPIEAIGDMNLRWLNGNIGPIIDILFTLLFLGMCFLTRPSIMQKDWNYLFTHYRKIIFYWIIYALVYAIFAELFSPEKMIVWDYPLWYPTFYYISSFIIAVFQIFLILFFADSVGGLRNFLRSFWNSLKMIIFNTPLIIIIGSFLYIPFVIDIGYGLYSQNILNYSLFLKYYHLIFILIAILLLPIFICPFANIYIKKVHDQFDLYFGKKNQ